MKTTLKRFMFYAGLGVLSILIVACGSNNSGGSTTNSPESVTRDVFTSMVKFDFDSVLPNICPERRQEFEQQFAELAPMLEDQRATIAGLDIDISNATFTVQNQTDTTADVNVTGQAIISDGTTTLNQDIATTENEPFRLVKIDNRWYVCGGALY
jgi:hypothetical protein